MKAAKENNSIDLDVVPSVEDKDDYLEDYEHQSYKHDKVIGEGSKYDNALMAQFFELAKQLAKLELKWKGFYIINKFDSKGNMYKDLQRDQDAAVAPDRFINDLITSIESVLSPHNSISSMSADEVYQVLWEKFDAFSRSVIAQPNFKTSSYHLMKEEYDHVLQLFMGHVKNAHGIKSAQALQAGVVAEYTGSLGQNKSVLDVGKELLLSAK